jgi:Fe-S-cluster containining protein
MSAQPFHANGLRFECTACGECCRARGSYCFVYVTLAERRRLAQHLGLKTAAFTREYCEKTNGFHHLRNPSNDCEFLDGSRCTVYAARPDQCRTWPFWPENMSKKAWFGEVKRDCPGIGRGRVHSRAEIELLLAAERRRQHQN